MNERKVTDEQQPPKQEAEGRDCWLLVVKDMEERRRHGIDKYGVPVREDNGRDHLVDAYQEALDLCVYLRAEIERRSRTGETSIPCSSATRGSGRWTGCSKSTG